MLFRHERRLCVRTATTHALAIRSSAGAGCIAACARGVAKCLRAGPCSVALSLLACALGLAVGVLASASGFSQRLLASAGGLAQRLLSDSGSLLPGPGCFGQRVVGLVLVVVVAARVRVRGLSQQRCGTDQDREDQSAHRPSGHVDTRTGPAVDTGPAIGRTSR